MTWPQVRSLAEVPEHQDPSFSVWRIAWVQHAIASGSPLFDANIFSPELRTFAYSDGTLLQGLAAAPLISLGVSPVVGYNLLVLTSFVACGLGAYVWARGLGVSFNAGMVAGTVFAVAPMRFDQYVHLEMLWTQWMPLAFWACFRLIANPTWKSAALLGGFLALQALSGLYGFVFLTTGITVYAVLTMLVEPRRLGLRTWGHLVLAALLAALIVVPYAQPYLANARLLGDRSSEELTLYGATLRDFVTAPSSNLFYSWTGRSWGRSELQLFPGFLAILLAGYAVSRPSRTVWPLLAVLAVGFELSRGGHGVLFQTLGKMGLGYAGLRVPARAAVLVHVTLASLAALGWDRFSGQLSSTRTRRVLFVVTMLALLGEYWTSVSLAPLPVRRSNYSAWLAGQHNEVVAEFPLPLPYALPGDDPAVQYESTFHWQRMINGYSGYYPASYVVILHECAVWGPSCLRTLRRAGVTLVTLHLNRHSERLSEIHFEQLDVDPGLRPVLTAESLNGTVRVYRIAEPQSESLR